MHRNRTLLLTCALLPMMTASLPAWAQSAVNINGMIDTGVYRDFDGITQVGTIQRSNLAFSGVEDVGDGMKAVFRLSTRFELDTGSSEGAGFKPFWHDESTVGLKADWGTVRLGRALTAMWANDYKFDPWANYNRIASPAWQHWHYLTPSDPFANHGTAEYGRLNNGVFYDSPVIGGFTLRLSGSPERQAALGGTMRPYSVVLEHEQGPLLLMAAVERNSVGDKDGFLAGRVRVGALTVNAAYDDSRSAGNAARSRATTLSASYEMGQVTLKTGLSRLRLDAGSNDFASLGADLALSRRTTLYSSLGHSRDGKQDGRTAFGVGIAHTF